MAGSLIEPYNALVRELFADPAHGGEVQGAAAGCFEDQGIRVRLAAGLDGERLRPMRYQVWGCPHVIAACEWICREFEGRPATDLESFESARIMTDLAVPSEKTGRILVVEDTVRSLWAAIRDRITTG